MIVRQDAQRLFDGKGASGAMLFVDPESSEGIRLGSSLSEGITSIPESRRDESIAALRTLREMARLTSRARSSRCSGSRRRR